mgnify:CR=1 FL=1
MLTSGDSGLEMLRTKARRCGENHQVHTTVDQLLVGIESDKSFRVLDLHLLANFLVVFQRAERVLAELIADAAALQRGEAKPLDGETKDGAHGDQDAEHLRAHLGEALARGRRWRVL